MSAAASPDLSVLAHCSRNLIRELGLVLERADTGATAVQAEALLALDAHGELTSGELAELLGVDKSAASRTLHQIVSKRWARRAQDDEDRRRKPLTLSVRGKAQATRVREATAAVLGDVLADIDPELVTALDTLSRTLRKRRRQQDFKLRPIERKDDPQVAAMLRQVMTEMGLVETVQADPEIERMYSSYTQPGSLYLVLEQGTHIVGGAGFVPLAGDGGTCELRKMYFRPEARGVGLGAHLLERCLREGRERGYKACYLETKREMEAARSLYEGFGFRKLKRAKKAGGACDSYYARSL